MEKIDDELDSAPNKLGWIAGGLVVVLVLAWLMQPLVIRALQSFLPVSWVSIVSSGAMKELEPLYGFTPVGKTSTQSIWADNMTQELREQFHRPELSLLVFETKVPTSNIFSLPDGKIIVTTTLLDQISDPSERRALLYHEIGHYVHNHAIQSVLHSVGSTFLAAESVNTEKVSEKLGSVIHLGYSVEEEDEADEFTLETLKEKGIAEDGYLQALKKIFAEGPAVSKLIPTFVSTHPAIAERIRKFETQK